ncbi:hypothetical protein ISS07_06170, partial [Candidatus Woesearchaeota archaeon]|nr:hypothetical protein [Candidatus Woesearchaeota archaeon]
EAEKILEDKGFKKEESKQILDKTHCNPPEDYFITSEDMVGKSGVWSHFGSWDFDRALIYKTLKSEEYEDNLAMSVEFLKERFDYSEEDAESLYYEVQSVTNSDQANSWIAPWPGYAGSVGCSRDENMLSCGNGFLVNLTSRDAWANSQQGLIRPKKISFPTEEGVFVREYDENVFKINNGRDLGLTLIKDGESYSMLQMDSDLVASMFTRLFYQEGHGLKYFKKFNDERSIFGGRIIVWKVDWEGKVIEDREKAEALQKALEEAQELDVIEEVVIESTDESIEIVEESKNESDILANNSDSSENTQ